MTDNYDLDAPEHAHVHDHDADHDHALENTGDHESKAEAWQDDQPPVDDLLEDGAEATEESGASHEEVVETPRRKSSILPIAVGIGCIAILGAIIYWQFSRAPSDNALQMAAATAPKTASTTVTKQAAPLPTEPEVAPKTDATANANTSSTVGSAMPINDPNTPAANIVPPPASPSQTASAGISATAPQPMAAPVTPVTTPSEPVSAPMPVVEATTVTSAPTHVTKVETTTPVIVASTENIDARIATLTSRVDDLKKSLDQATQQLAQAQAGVVLSGSPSSATGNVQVDERLTKIEQQLAQLQRTPATGAPALVPPIISSSEPEVATESINSSVAIPPKHTTHHKAVKTHKASRKVAKTHNSTLAPTVKGFVLRAATPDEAWVAKDATTPDLRHVQVGDDVVGVGRIKAIHQVGESWVVEGTKGTIR